MMSGNCPAFRFLKSHILQNGLQKTQREKEVINFLAFLSNFFPVKGYSIPWINLTYRYGSFDTHFDILNDILCHMAYVIKCHKMKLYDIL